jgi:hypothetical protein
MTSKQMNRAIRKHGISLVYDRTTKTWWAGDAAVGLPEERGTFQVGSEEHAAITVVLTVEKAGSRHCGTKPEQAVEDYCNARDLSWDV